MPCACSGSGAPSLSKILAFGGKKKRTHTKKRNTRRVQKKKQNPKKKSKRRRSMKKMKGGALTFDYVAPNMQSTIQSGATMLGADKMSETPLANAYTMNYKV